MMHIRHSCLHLRPMLQTGMYLQRAAEVFLPVAAFGELCYGACHSTRRDENLARLDAFARRVAVLHCDSAGATP